MMQGNQPNPTVSQLKTPPHSLGAEQSVLGGLMILDATSQKSREVLDCLTDAMFYNRSHSIIFRAIRNFIGKQVDVIIVSEFLESKELLEDAGGMSYILELTKNTPSAANIMSYAGLIKERYQQREMIHIANSIAEQSYQLTKPDETKEYAVGELVKIDGAGIYEPVNISSILPNWVNNLEARTKGDVNAVGRKTGIKTLDEQIVGLGVEWLVLLVGRPSMGKTLIAQLISGYIARTAPVLFFSMEMSDIEIVDRYIGIFAGVNPKNLRKGELTDMEWSRVAPIMEQINSGRINIFFDETPALSIDQISARSKATRKRHGQLGLIVVDYLELMTRPKAEREDIALSEICRRLKQLAKEIQTPVLLLGQANRETDRVNRPTMSNVKGGTGIEANCDLILFAHREEVNNPETEFQGVTEIIPAKYRHGTCVRTSYLKQDVDEFGGMLKCLSYADTQALINREDERKKSKSKPRSKDWVK